MKIGLRVVYIFVLETGKFELPMVPPLASVM